MKNTYVIDVTSTALYTIRADSEEEAVERALEYFDERTPEVHVDVDNNAEPEVTI